MKVINRQESWLLLLGDIVIFVLSLWLSLVVRFGQIPAVSLFEDLLIPFSILFVVWGLVFFIAGLYEKHTTIFKSHLPTRIFNTQIFNSFLAVVFFYFIPYFGVTPKVILFIYIIISLALILAWRIYGQRVFGLKSKEEAMVLGRGAEMGILVQEVNSNPIYGLEFVSSFDLDKLGQIDFQKDILQKIKSMNISVVVLDLQSENLEKNLSNFYNLLFSKIHFVDINNLYEDIFDRVPLSLVSYGWFLKNISLAPKVVYSFLKRFSDIIFGIIIGLVFIIAFPFVALAIYIEDGKPIFYSHKRVGKNGKEIKISKFRSMSILEKEKITKVGAFIRKTRIDELPQFWAILNGDLSLIGPRPEKPDLVELYNKEIPYYNIRHLIKPGLSGWAQICQDNPPKFEVNFEDTKTKLSYDLYYLKNKSAMLDLIIILKTIKSLILRVGK